MNLFRNLKITHQFLILFGVLIIGFAAIGLIYKQVLDAQQVSAARLQRVNLFGDLVNRAAQDFLALDGAQANFRRTGDLQAAEDFDVLADQAEQKINALEQNVPEDKALGLVTQMEEGLTVYTDTFDALLDTKVLLGLHENRGCKARCAQRPMRSRTR